ncbi:MAG TPA: MarR family transcriptional regulator [Mycobacteriales bacterium]|nr:MarR family transcriptional regulator [Mycobacteriales bacterium]
MNEPDLAILVVGAARVVADRLGAAVVAAGIDDMSTRFGFVVRALADRDRTLTELAELLAVSKQAAIKVVDEMEARGFLDRVAHPGDRRVKLLRLTAKGRAVRAAALAASHDLEAQLRETAGDGEVDAFLRTLHAFLATHDATPTTHSRALW